MGLQWMQAIPNDGTQTTHAAPPAFELHVRIRLARNGWAGLGFGLEGGSGWALMVNAGVREAHLLQLKNDAVWLDRGLRRLDFQLDTWYEMRARYAAGVLRVTFCWNPLDKEPWPTFEIPLALAHSSVTLDCGRDVAEFAGLTIREAVPEDLSIPTFTNPVMVGADPDILLHKGVYYLYNRVPNDPSSAEDAYLYSGSERAALDRAGEPEAVFRVASSPDLVHWSPYRTVFTRDETLKGAFCMSPNVVEKDGWFYLFFAGGRLRGEESFHIYCASAQTPEGPFTLKSAKPLHPDTEEIGGMPFVDDDGTVYLSLVRFHHGNELWLQQITLSQGVAFPGGCAAVPVLAPREDYEVDEHGRIVEGAVFIRHQGLYYMIYADGHYLGHYGESCAVSKSIYGPYTRQSNNPILHHHFLADGVGDGIVIYNQDRTQMYMGYHRHVSAEAVEPRMTCLDRMKFVPDPRGGPPLLTVYGPTVTPQPIPFFPEAHTPNKQGEENKHEYHV